MSYQIDPELTPRLLVEREELLAWAKEAYRLFKSGMGNACDEEDCTDCRLVKTAPGCLKEEKK